MKKLILLTDFLGTAPNFKINSQSRYQTLFGGIISILTYMLILVAGGYFTDQLFNNKTKTITYNIVPSLNVIQNISNFPYMIMLQNNFFYPFDDQSRYYYIHSEIWETKQTKEGGNSVVKTTRNVVKHEYCDLNKHFGEYKEYFKNVPYLEKHLCPVPGANNLTLYGVYGSNSDYSYFTHYISRCLNNTVFNGNVTNCHEDAVIRKALENSFVSFKFLDMVLDHNDPINPGKFNLRSEALPVSSTIFKREWFVYRPVEYITDLGLVFEDYKNQSYFKVNPVRETVDLRTQGSIPGSFAMVTSIMDSQYDSFSRSFMKAQQVLANLGGVIKGLAIIANIFTFIFVNEIYYFDLVKVLFDCSPEQNQNFSNDNQSQSELISKISNFSRISNKPKDLKILKIPRESRQDGTTPGMTPGLMPRSTPSNKNLR